MCIHMQHVTIPGHGTFEVPDDKVSDLIRFLNSLRAVDVTEALRSKQAPTDPTNRLIYG